MQFPTYVPDVVREHVMHYVEAYQRQRERFEVELEGVEKDIWVFRGAEGYSDTLDLCRLRKTEIASELEKIAGTIEVITRLAQDKRMEAVY